jgi:hypothetical protein
MINNCQDDEIILTLDGDDWFPDNNVLNKLDTIYSGGQVWMTYGQYKNSNDNTTGVAQPYPQHIIDSNAFRNHIWSASHLRTFYAWLFKKIKKEDLMKDGNFFPMTWDFAMMFPMLEMSGNHSKFLPDILYVYNTENPINDHKVNIALQHDLDAYIRRKPKYQKISSFITFKELGKFGRIGNQFFQVAILIALADKYNDIIKANWYCHYTNKDMLSYFKHKIMHQAPLASEIEFNYKEPNFSFNEIPYHKNMNLHGYFQSELYFDHCQELIKYYFEPTDELVAKLQNKYGKYLDLNTCSLHIRRGDFVGNQTHSVCDLDYYTRAINSINSTEKIDHFLVFSDDIPWCINNFPSNYIFVDGNLDIEDLFLMSLCKHNIISNSTFSWWSAWLNKNQSKIIMAPSKWFTNQTNINDKDIYTKEMIRI